ncbi:MAG TPA: sigma-70 family RNA polymerase sigma factor [Acidobacteriaceae bacterium]
MEQGSTRLAEVFAREKSRFLRFVQHQLFDRDEADAEDIVSDVAFNLLRRGDLVGEIENLTAYIYRSLTNRITDQRRGRVPMVALDAEESEQAAAVEIPDDRPGPEQALEQHELHDRLAAALDKLAPKERAVWLATEVDGRSFRELAEEWDEPMGTLLSRKSRAAAALRRSLADYRDR